MSGYASNLTFEDSVSSPPTYSVGIEAINFTQGADVLSGFYELIPNDLTQMSIWKALPVNNWNSFLMKKVVLIDPTLEVLLYTKSNQCRLKRHANPMV
jgi:hypothetical protein